MSEHAEVSVNFDLDSQYPHREPQFGFLEGFIRCNFVKTDVWTRRGMPKVAALAEAPCPDTQTSIAVNVRD